MRRPKRVLPTRSIRIARVLLGLIGAAPSAAEVSPWQLPAEGSCLPERAAPGDEPGGEAGFLSFRPGDVIGYEQLAVLRDYFPPEIWAQREMLFYEGMKLEIGPCYRDYGAPGFYAEATEKFRG